RRACADPGRPGAADARQAHRRGGADRRRDLARIHRRRARRQRIGGGLNPMKIKRIEHIAIAVDNLKEISALLQDKFGLSLEYEEDRVQTRLAMLPVGQTYIELLEGT